MSTQQQQSTRDDTTIEDFDAIAAAIQLYIDGSAQGDAAKLAEAFHPDAQMYGAVGDQRFDEPMTEFFKLVAETPAGDTFRARITSITQAGDAATAIVAEDGSGAHCPSWTFSRSAVAKGAGGSSTKPSLTPAVRCRTPSKQPAARIVDVADEDDGPWQHEPDRASFAR